MESDERSHGKESNDANNPADRLEELQFSDQPNKALRKMLADRWKYLPEEKKLCIRAARAKRGIKCPICGKIGYFMENCSNGCVSPPKTPDSWASTPPGTPPKSPVGLGVLWGDRTEDPPSPYRYDYTKKVDSDTTRPPALEEAERLRELDSKIGTFEFFAEAEEGYADSYAQMSLHQVMRRLMRLLERQLRQNVQELESKFDSSLLHPPVRKEQDKFYPPELRSIKEYRDYFLEREEKKELKRVYQNQASLRCADELDPLFRGGDLRDDFLYKTNPRAGASMHSKNTWKSILSHSDDLASSDPSMARKEARLQRLFKSQSKWIASQQKSMAHKNDRFEHLVHILRQEITHEHEREYRNLETDAHGEKATQMKVYQDRLNAVDRIMACLHSYNFTSGLDEADFLFFCFEKWKETLESKVYGKNRHRVKKVYLPPTARSSNEHNAEVVSSSGGNKGGGKPLFSRSMTGLTDVSSVASSYGSLGGDTKESQSTTALGKFSGAEAGYNRLISEANPYAKDIAFLGYMKRKHEAVRRRAMAPRLPAAETNDAHTVSSSSSLVRPPVLRGTTGERAPALMRSNNTDDASVDAAASEQAVHESGGALAGKHGAMRLHRQVSFASDVSLSSAQSSVQDSSSGFIYSDHSPSRDNSSLLAADRLRGIVVPQHHQHPHAHHLVAGDGGDGSSRASLSAGSSIYDASPLVRRSTGASSHSNKTLKQATTGSPLKRRLPPRVVDEINIEKAKGAFKRAGLKGHIRKGQDNDLAYLAPTLIPVPGAFQADGSNPLISHTAENILFKVKKAMILSDIGYTPQCMVPLYARNTLIEANGTSPGGDQNYLVMAKDRRYSHYVGRPLNRFEPDEAKLKMKDEFNPINLEILKDSLSNPARQMRLMTSALAKTLETKAPVPRGPTRKEKQEMEERARKAEEAHRHRQERRLIHEEMEKAKGLPLTQSLVRLAFKDPLPSLADLAHVDD